jgi:hypothetical protein
MSITLERGAWITGPDGARAIGLTPEALATRRRREGPRHPRHVRVGMATLYFEPELRRYAQEWRDGRLR